MEVGTEMFKVSFDLETVAREIAIWVGAGRRAAHWLTMAMGLLAWLYVLTKQVKGLRDCVLWCDLRLRGPRSAEKCTQTEPVVILDDVAETWMMGQQWEGPCRPRVHDGFGR